LGHHLAAGFTTVSGSAVFSSAAITTGALTLTLLCCTLPHPLSELLQIGTLTTTAGTLTPAGLG
jgi:hypothetical protein